MGKGKEMGKNCVKERAIKKKVKREEKSQKRRKSRKPDEDRNT